LAQSAPQDKAISAFWDYVSKNQQKIATAVTGDQALWYEIAGRVQNIDQGLAVRTYTPKTGKTQIVITAGGNASLFDLCDRVVGKAPAMDRLTPVSLLPPAQEFLPYIYMLGDRKVQLAFDDVLIHCDDFSATDLDLAVILPAEHYDIIQNVPNYDMMSFYHNVSVDMIMQVLGERLMVKRVASVELMPVNAVMPAVRLPELKTLIK